jgi:hypothetical protein
VKTYTFRIVAGTLLLMAGGILFLDRFLKTGWLSLLVLPAIGLQGSQSFFWRWLHEQATNLTLLLLGLHVALHWKWIASMTRTC